ncbi:DUF503 family protein [Listeria grandensis]|uniref:DUF503 domain-containing protein n=1 Tax=Listeria grandensis FSL F6-0971 TaxID=1265819 RepID=W7BG52_9LIST|nr:DUF503 family protein [Listeria grandensis]EUJ24862.1 hypothetical protein PGRAN_03205 [Listeria grandensis FSL F6-0971]MBC1473118.1 DUF503 family protein [Listeria grandensis]MBC6314636.1 DUF503 family protein [Listeria grandensis]
MIRYVESEWFLQTPQTLKQKRAILKRVLTRAGQKFNISIAEIGFQDKWQRALIGFAVVSESHNQAEKMADTVLVFLDSFPEWERGKTTMESL